MRVCPDLSASRAEAPRLRTLRLLVRRTHASLTLAGSGTAPQNRLVTCGGAQTLQVGSKLRQV